MTQAIIFLLGLMVGSFLNVVIHRLPKEESIVLPPSHCPKCKKAIAWFDNFPVLSFILLGGRCRHCREKISIRYPLIELISGLIWFVSWKTSGFSPAFVIDLLFLSLLLVAAVTDWETGLIMDEVTFLGMGGGLVASFFYPNLHHVSGGYTALGKSALGLVVGGGLIYGIGVLGNWIFKKESMGGGDVKLLAMIGSFIGWEKVLLTFFTAPVLALPFALYERWVKKEQTIVYGPFLSLAAGVQFFYGHFFLQYFWIGG